MDIKELTINEIKSKGEPFTLLGAGVTFYRHEHHGQKLCSKIIQFTGSNFSQRSKKTEGLIEKYREEYKFENIFQTDDTLKCVGFLYNEEGACFVYEDFKCNLEEFMKREKISYEKKLQIMVSIGSCVREFKEKGICIRNINPNNIIICSFDKMSITTKLSNFYDYAIIQQNSCPEKPANISQFTAPQILSNSRHGHEADVWSLGLIFYKLMFGNTNGVRPSPEKKQTFISFPYQLPEWLENTFHKLLEYNQKERYSVEDALMMFKSALNCAGRTSKILEKNEQAKF